MDKIASFRMYMYITILGSTLFLSAGGQGINLHYLDAEDYRMFLYEDSCVVCRGNNAELQVKTP